jgi:hypothetical protein
MSFFFLSVAAMLPFAYIVIAALKKENLEILGYTALCLLLGCLFVYYALAWSVKLQRTFVFKGFLEFVVKGALPIFYLSMLILVVGLLDYVFSSPHFSRRTGFMLFGLSAMTTCMILSCIFYHLFLIFIAKLSSLAFNVTPISEGYYKRIPVGGLYFPGSNTVKYTYFDRVYSHYRNTEFVSLWVTRCIVHLVCAIALVMVSSGIQRSGNFWDVLLAKDTWTALLGIFLFFVLPFEWRFEATQMLAFGKTSDESA